MLQKPVLRWAGGKTWMTKTVSKFLPSSFNNYHEPFLGGAAVFIFLSPQKRSYLSDCNYELINFYKQVKENLNSVIVELKKYKNEEEFYYELRNKQVVNEIECAAKFYFLNKTCFNGIYRVNRKGEFNVPYGFRKEINFNNFSELKAMQFLFEKNVFLKAQDFEVSLKKVKKGDLVFIDPPYTVAHNNNGFIEYNQNIFSWFDQERLSQCVEKIDKIGAYFILTNAVHNSIIKLYSKIGKKYEIERYSTISGHMKDRKKVSEFIITNCI